MPTTTAYQRALQEQTIKNS